MNLKKYSSFLRRWHVRIGMTAALMLLALSITGILINHSAQLGFGQRTLPSWLASWSYGVEEIPMQSLQTDAIRAEAYQGNLSVAGVSNITQLSEPRSCQGALLGVIEYGSEIWLACEAEISLYIQDETNPVYIEQLTRYSGLPTPIDKFGLCDETPCITSDNKVYLYVPQTNKWQTPESTKLQNWSQPPNCELRSLVPAELNWDRWLLDLHAGRLFGSLGIWLVDITGIAVLLLVFSGFLRWFSTRDRDK